MIIRKKIFLEQASKGAGHSERENLYFLESFNLPIFARERVPEQGGEA